MLEYTRPRNPFADDQDHAFSTHALINACVETLAVMSIPMPGEDISGLIIASASCWTQRLVPTGSEGVCHEFVWELSTWIHRMVLEADAPFPPFDVTTQCNDDECKEDHSAEIEMVNELFVSGSTGKHGDAVKAYAKFVHAQDPGEWRFERQNAIAALMVHTSERVSQFRLRTVDEMPSLGD